MNDEAVVARGTGVGERVHEFPEQESPEFWIKVMFERITSIVEGVDLSLEVRVETGEGI